MKRSAQNMQNLPNLRLPRKPTYLKVKSDVDFFQLFLHIERDCETCFLLESLEVGNPDARYDVIGFAPQALVRALPDWLVWEAPDSVSLKISTKNPYQTLAQWLPQNTISRNYAGGLVGYLSYDAGNFFEPSLDLKYHSAFPPLLFGLYTDGLIYDKLTGEVLYFYYHKSRLPLVRQWLKARAIIPAPLHVRSQGLSCAKTEHKKMVMAVLKEIRSGNTFQCQIGFQENYEWKGDLLAFYQQLRQVNPSPHMYYMKFQDRILVGSSPELAFRLRQGEMETFPLAGTTRRGANVAEDIRLARRLLNDSKEIAEHNMLVDLHRNDIGRVARFGSIRVRHLMDTKKFSHVQHISSEVGGMIRKDEDMFSGLAAVFPAGTLSGAPKIESMKIIERTERSPRGPYGGAVGHFGFNGDCTFAIPIRTLFVYGQEAFARASGGIVYDSTAKNEYIEIERKLAAIRRALEGFL